MAFRSAPIFDRGSIVRLAAWYAEQHRLEDASREYQRLADRDRGDTSALRRAAEIDLQRGALAGAASAMRAHADRLAAKGHRLTALFRYRKLAEVVARLPEAQKKAHLDFQSSVDRLRQELATHKKALAAHDAGARAFERAGDDAELVELSQKMTGLAPDNPVFQARLAEALCRLGRIDDALPCFRAAAEALVELERASDALLVIERILHFRAGPDDAILAAELYLARGERNDPMRAITKLSSCLASDPESLDALLLLARAFEAMSQPTRAAQVRIELSRIARAAGETELAKDVLRAVSEAAAGDDEIDAVLRASEPEPGSSAAELSYRSSLGSVMESDLEPLEPVIAETRAQSDGSVLDEIAFEELSEDWVMPVLSKAARRALEEAETFKQMRLVRKADAVLRAAILEDPVCADLREALRQLLDSTGDVEGFVEETLNLAELYGERQFSSRARALIAQALQVAPGNERARAAAAALEVSGR